MASRSPAIFLLLALPLLCYVVSIEAHTLPDDIVPDSRGLSDAIVPESSVEARATKGLNDGLLQSRLTKGSYDECGPYGDWPCDENEEELQARATKGLNDGLLQSRLTKGRQLGSDGECERDGDCEEIEEELQARATKGLNDGLLQSRLTKGSYEDECGPYGDWPCEEIEEELQAR